MSKELHRISVTGIIYRQKKDGSLEYLITKRSLEKKAFGGMWTVPGGGLSTNDYINTPKTTKDHWYFAVTETLKREIKEEVDLEISKPKYLLDITFIRPDGVPVIILSYYCKYKTGKVKLDSDSVDFKWVTLPESKKYKLIEGIYEEIEMVEKILNT